MSKEDCLCDTCINYEYYICGYGYCEAKEKYMTQHDGCDKWKDKNGEREDDNDWR